MTSKQEIERMAKNPDLYLLLDDLNVRIQKLVDLTETSIKRMDKLVAYANPYTPMKHMFRRDLQYQFATVQPGQSGQVYLLENPQPELLVGLINEVGCTAVGGPAFPNTYFEWIIDGVPKTVRYQIAPTNAPKEYEKGIPFDDRVVWRAYNNDIVAHVFQVLCDGYFIDRELYRKIVSEEYEGVR